MIKSVLVCIALAGLVMGAASALTGSAAAVRSG